MIPTEGMFVSECEYCKERMELKLPISVRALAKLISAFEDSHKECTE